MKYFELFGWEPHFKVDISALKKQYYALSRESHPDFFTLGSAEDQASSLADSTLLNLAYKTLKDPNLLLKYILDEEGLILEGKTAAMPQRFLMEMMDINESIMELQFEPDRAKYADAKQAFETRLKALQTEGDQLKAAYDAGSTAENLAALKDYYFKMKYLVRMRENLEQNVSLD